MNYDEFGRSWVNCDKLTELIYSNPNINIDSFLVNDVVELDKYKLANQQLYAGLAEPQLYIPFDQSIEDFDFKNQQNWHMPDQYQQFDIVTWLLDQCKEDYELQRVGQELLLYQKHNLINLLRYLKYLVDTLRNNNIVWGVGRGSSVSSYVLFLIGIHKINSCYYDLDIEEFFKQSV